MLGRPLDSDLVTTDAPGVTVERLRAEDERTWIDIAVTAFSNLDGTGSAADDSSQLAEMEEVMADFAAGPGTQRYLARLDGRPVGSGSLVLAGDLAQLAGAGTLPDARDAACRKPCSTAGWPTRARRERISRWW